MLRDRLYYEIKPLVPYGVRMAVRRWFARRKRQRVGDVWPILPGSEKPPENWAGWPNGKQFAFVLTHDVESSAGYAKCRALMQLEKELGFRSSFNFVPEGEYRLRKELREELASEGFEVGVHDLHHDGKLYPDRDQFLGRARRINDYLKEWGAIGFRAGFMRHNLEWQHALDIQYDCSTFDTDPFEPQPDGVGTIFPFWVPCTGEVNSRFQVACSASARRAFAEVTAPADSRAGSGSEASALHSQLSDSDSLSLAVSPPPSGYVELPYTLPQDSTLFLLFREQTPEVWFRKLDWVAKHGGMALVNVHPDYMQMHGEPASGRTYPADLYRQLLEYVDERYRGAFWHCLPRDVSKYVLSGTTSLNGSHSRSDGKPNITSTTPEALPVSERPGQTVMDPVESRNPPVVVNQTPLAASSGHANGSSALAWPRLAGKRAAVLLFSYYPSDPRPRRAAEALIAENMSVDLICLKGSKEELRKETVNGVNVFRVPLKRRRGGKLAYIWQYSAFILISLVTLAFRGPWKRYHLVHVHNMPDVLVFGALIPKMLGARVILDLHDPMPELMMTIFKRPAESRIIRLLKRAEKWSISFADLVLTPNVAFQNLFTSRSCPSGKLHTVMNSPDEGTFSFRAVTPDASLRDPSKPFVILYHGSLVARHGLDIAVDALEQVRKSIPNAIIAVCGEQTPYLEEVMETVKRRGLQDAVQYRGKQNRHGIVKAIEECDVGIIPNRRSVFTEINMPTRIFEYLALAKPAIAPSTRGIQDYFSPQELVYFEPDNADDLARKIEFVATHPYEIREIIERGQAIYKMHRWSQEKSKFVNLVGETLGV